MNQIRNKNFVRKTNHSELLSSAPMTVVFISQKYSPRMRKNESIDWKKPLPPPSTMEQHFTTAYKYYKVYTAIQM